jgi:hypothetical protein
MRYKALAFIVAISVLAHRRKKLAGNPRYLGNTPALEVIKGTRRALKPSGSALFSMDTRIIVKKMPNILSLPRQNIE